MLLEDGVLLGLPRDEAKSFFGFREDGPRLEFIKELLENDAIIRTTCQGKWENLHAALSQTAIASSFLSQAILGGRPFYQGEAYHVILVRPDVVGFIHKQLQDISLNEYGDLAPTLHSVSEFYSQAAAAQQAVVFVAKCI